jgi:hypothetical protein
MNRMLFSLALKPRTVELLDLISANALGIQPGDEGEEEDGD